MWSATMDDMDITSTTCDDVDEKFDIDDEIWDHYWIRLQMGYSQPLCLKETRSVT